MYTDRNNVHLHRSPDHLAYPIIFLFVRSPYALHQHVCAHSIFRALKCVCLNTRKGLQKNKEKWLKVRTKDSVWRHLNMIQYNNPRFIMGKLSQERRIWCIWRHCTFKLWLPKLNAAVLKIKLRQFKLRQSQYYSCRECQSLNTAKDWTVLRLP